MVWAQLGSSAAHIWLTYALGPSWEVGAAGMAVCTLPSVATRGRRGARFECGEAGRLITWGGKVGVCQQAGQAVCVLEAP